MSFYILAVYLSLVCANLVHYEEYSVMTVQKTMGTSYANNRQQMLVTVVTSGTMLTYLIFIHSFVAREAGHSVYLHFTLHP